MTTEKTNQGLPQKIDTVTDQLEAIMKLLEKNQPAQAIPKKLNLSNAIAFMAGEGCDLSKSLVYKLTSTNAIPVRRFGRKLIFDRDELLQWCKDRTSLINSENEVIINLAKTANKKTNHGK